MLLSVALSDMSSGKAIFPKEGVSRTGFRPLAGGDENTVGVHVPSPDPYVSSTSSIKISASGLTATRATVAAVAAVDNEKTKGDVDVVIDVDAATLGEISVSSLSSMTIPIPRVSVK